MRPGSGGRPVAIIGCGLIGESWAGLLLSHGIDVRAWDPSEQARAGFAARVGRICAQLSDMSVADGVARGTLVTEDSVTAAMRDVFWIQENAPESVGLKQALYAEIEAAWRHAAAFAAQQHTPGPHGVGEAAGLLDFRAGPDVAAAGGEGVDHSNVRPFQGSPVTSRCCSRLRIDTMSWTTLQAIPARMTAVPAAATSSHGCHARLS